MRNVDRNEDIGAFLLQAQEGENDRGKVWRVAAVLGRVRLRGLCGDESVGWDFGAILHDIIWLAKRNQISKDEEHARCRRDEGLPGSP